MEVVLGACTWEQNEPAKAMGGSLSHKGKEPWFHGVGGAEMYRVFEYISGVARRWKTRQCAAGLAYGRPSWVGRLSCSVGGKSGESRGTHGLAFGAL